MKKLFLLAGLVASASLSFALPFEDDFNSTEIDQSKWQVRLPFSDSTVVEGGGVVTIRNGGQLITKDSFTEPYQATGRIKIAGNQFDTLVLNFRSDGLSDPAISPNELINSLQVRFTKYSDPGALINLVYMQDRHVSLGEVSYPYEIGQWYDFKFVDDGSAYSFYLGDMNTALLSGVSAQPAGKFGIYNRPGVGGGSSISEGSVIEIDNLKFETTSVPDSGSSLIFLAMACACLRVFVPKN